MNQAQLDQLEREQIAGSKAAHSYEQFIKAFADDKRRSLFEAFRLLPTTAEIELMEVKRMLYAIDTLEQEIMNVIQTGQMAGKTLSENEDGVTH